MPTEKQLKKMLKSQQAELNGVLMYLKLADAVKVEEISVKMKEVAADEGRHAALLHSFTQMKLTPEDKMAKLIVRVYRLLGLKITLKLISIGEYLGARVYQDLVDAYPELTSMQDDETRHGEIFKEIAKMKVASK